MYIWSVRLATLVTVCVCMRWAHCVCALGLLTQGNEQKKYARGTRMNMAFGRSRVITHNKHVINLPVVTNCITP